MRELTTELMSVSTNEAVEGRRASKPIICITITMAEAEKTPEQLQDDLDALNAKITSQGATVRTLKKEGGSAEDIAEAVKLLQELKIEAGSLNDKLKSNEPEFNRKAFDDLVLRKMFVVPSFEIHGGVKGLFDLGPPACALKVRLRK